MKLYSAILLAGAFSGSAAIIQFDLSPAGTDVAVGLSPSNQVPAVTNSTGSGNTISAGILLDTEQSLLQLAVGYGSAAGFSDLSGPATDMHIHGLAPAGQSAGVIMPLAPHHFPAADPARGGIIFGTLSLTTETVSNLLAGYYYLNIHTALNPGGEIRGQLIRRVELNEAPVVICSAATTSQCGTRSTTTVLVSDPEGDALTVIWSLNGEPVKTNLVAASHPPVVTPLTLSAMLPQGTNLVGVAATDSAGNTTSCSSMITVEDSVPPVISSVTAEPNMLWPPNHQMVPITLRVVATDNCGPVRWRIARVSSNESPNGPGDGNTGPDYQIIQPHGLKLRAERSGHGNGRVYTIAVQALDAAGNVSRTKTVTVTVPKSQGRR